MRVLDDIQVKSVLELYQSGQSCPALARKFNVAAATIDRYVRLSGIPKRGLKESTCLACGGLDLQTKNTISILYQDGMSCCDLSVHFSISIPTVYKYLYQMNTPMRDLHTSHLKHKLNNDYFSSISNQETAYWAGFIAADGSVASNSLRIGLALKDKEHLELFSKHLESSAPVSVHHYNKNGNANFEVCSRQIILDLGKIGIVPRKTTILTWPNLPYHLLRHYLRGYFDGDGSISFSKKTREPRFSLCGNIEFLIKCQQFLMAECQLKATKISPAGSSMVAYNLAYGGTQQVPRIANFLYREADVCLERKRDVMRHYLQTRPYLIAQYPDLL